MVDRQISHPDDVGEALRLESLVPPAAPATLGDGSTADLRDSMARFSGRDTHSGRRTAVESAVASLDLAELSARTGQLTKVVLGRPEIEAMSEIAFVVPTRVMAEALGTATADLDGVRADVRTVVSAIGRLEPATEQTEQATDRLMQRFANHPDGPVAAISLLYQNHDATAALLASALVAETDDSERRPALSRTVRVATASVVIGDAFVDAGETVVLSLESPVNAFGAGPHECPGRAAAEVIVAGVLDELVSAGYRLDVSAMVTRNDGRAATLPMVRVSAS